MNNFSTPWLGGLTTSASAVHCVFSSRKKSTYSNSLLCAKCHRTTAPRYSRVCWQLQYTYASVSVHIVYLVICMLTVKDAMLYFRLDFSYILKCLSIFLNYSKPVSSKDVSTLIWRKISSCHVTMLDIENLFLIFRTSL